MQYRNLGRSGLKISPICLGTMMFGGPTDEATSTRIVAKAREAGINFIDTADAYNNGNSEAVVGRAISNSRQSWILATKLANQMGDDPNRGGLSRRWVLKAVDESLQRLGTDFIDIYYLHKEDHATPDKDTRAGRNDKRMMQTEWRPESIKLAQEIKRHAEARGITSGQFAVSWVLNSSFVSAVIAGPRTEQQWDDYLRALDYRFTAEDEALIDRLVVSGHPSTPGYNDPAYPIEGRRARTG